MILKSKLCSTSTQSATWHRETEEPVQWLMCRGGREHSGEVGLESADAQCDSMQIQPHGAVSVLCFDFNTFPAIIGTSIKHKGPTFMKKGLDGYLQQSTRQSTTPFQTSLVYKAQDKAKIARGLPQETLDITDQSLLEKYGLWLPPPCAGQSSLFHNP